MNPPRHVAPRANRLFYGDNLDVLRQHVDSASVDLVYLDPPFNSARNYNVLFEARSGTESAAQIKAFDDTWRWDIAAAEAYREMVEAGGSVSDVLRAFFAFLGPSDMMAYIAMMAPRLTELRRVLKTTGSLYLHCDPTASHYLKLLLDAVFGPRCFRSEIIWKRSTAHSDTKQGMGQPGRIHDTLLFYTKGDTWTWNPVHVPYDESYIKSHYSYVEEGTGRRFRLSDLTAAKPGGDTEYAWKGVKPYKGRYWAYSRQGMEQFEREGRLYYTKTGMPNYKRYLDEMPGVPLQDLWTDIFPVNSQAAERLGYPTQKPVALLERIIAASSNPGDVVLDPFCGCGTAVAAAQKLGRHWLGIDVTHLAINLIRTRLQDTYGSSPFFDVVGEPTTLEDAAELARTDPYQFQWWALSLVGARPAEARKGADRGIDGRLLFLDGRNRQHQQIIISVKAGHVTVAQLRDLRGVLDREKAAMGVLISLEEPTRAMRAEAATAGFFQSAWGRHPRLQLLTIADALGGRGIDRPMATGVNQSFKQAPRAAVPTAPMPELFELPQPQPPARAQPRPRH